MPLIPRDRLRSPRLIQIAAYLDSKRSDGAPPRRSDLDPITEIPKLAQHLLLIERTEFGRFRNRLSGSVVGEIHGRDYTGFWMDEIAMDEAQATWKPGLPALFETDELLCGADRPPWRERAHIQFEWVSQRLTVPPGKPALVLVALDQQLTLPSP